MDRYIPERKQKRNRKNNEVTPGVYTAVVTSVVSPDGFAAGQAVDVIYAVSIKDGTAPFSERFLIADRYSPRTKEFESLLDSIGAKRYEDLVGFELELTFAYEVKRGRAWCNIIERKLLTGGDDNGSGC